ncbi:isoaspartyl peptidase/L-asparaginase family protein [Pleionea sp. CnH1-48]|uniref:isoaspartyl peptidase/L-asparaginase family protein n=1 Tax=Pleionea sp. CnH1-48 TaxID=2954494 RepID=UPI0020973EFC|nr:isoaspartyl peptidase/L-asparaginase [Pleionea sp. CnH1-48]MCO7226834.1 isoaspartyl peptidase/L-asparaginase [Pleionea sp. CnH1-48]
MRVLFVFVMLSMSTWAVSSEKKAISQPPFAIAIHGGAGTILKENLSPRLERAYHKKMTEALKAGYEVLVMGGSSVDAVQTTIVILEDSPLFNAGKGSVFTHEKTNELDASIMEGKHLNAGAISGVSNVKNPIKLAHAVMTQSKHVMLSGGGAEVFAEKNGLDIVDSGYFYTERRWNQLMRVLKDNSKSSRLSEDKDDQFSGLKSWPDDDKFGTVGAVALDQAGNLAAGTSTGGMTNKKFGRIGDSPVIGAGTYADNNACAVSATGHGEYFIRASVAHDICARVLYKNISLQQAADEVIKDKLVKMKGEGGVVALDPKGNPVFSFNSVGMYRGYIDKDGNVYTGIFKEPLKTEEK